MESVDLIPLIEQLDDNVDDLEEALAPILESTVVESSKKLPVLDKAKFHVLITYALESLIFSYLRLHGVKATEHPVFRELTRVRQYFDKIKSLETDPEQRTMVLDKQAAGRFIKHGLAGNEKFDLQREEQMAKEKARAQLKASLLAKKAGATPEASSKVASGDSEDSDANPNTGPASGVEETDASQSMKTSDKDAGRARKHKNSKTKSGAKDGKHKKGRSKEERRERRNERRKKKDESRKARKET
ncbi:Sas10/Utp3/C1D family protein [Aspergillus puulaauensis]|uniref:Exosome complex protein n=1 Tax=Aspergillus puulaauensis TaxID=1220207 RepID=A0A7R7XKT6_9EURO|nr:uncharacterized protein APUU_31143S [Aspergillus puulaauensis]BCS22918.1 hypothetical protein APUU_31143S [Aspergillus puulaauensis]